jgi:pyruvate dehydrogenase E2 component (dihydrolipoamide acetyltransferase)
MATVVIMPRQGNTVESCILAGWKKKKGDSISKGDVLCDVETDKALVEVESPASGTVLELFFQEGDDVPVLTNIAVIGEPGEDVAQFSPDQVIIAPASIERSNSQGTDAVQDVVPQPITVVEDTPSQPATSFSGVGISPRAIKLAETKGISLAGISGSGPGGRIIERDVLSAANAQQRLTPLARSVAASGNADVPASGSGIGGRVTARDLASRQPQVEAHLPPDDSELDNEVEIIPLKGVRKVIADRMLESMQTTAQLTLNASADAKTLLAYRKRLKNSPEDFGLQKVTINDILLFVVSRALVQYPALNALFQGDTISQYKNVHLACAVDTPRGLVVPVIRNANTLSLKQIAQESKRLAGACLEGTITPVELNSGTFTVTNLGNLGVESFTPVLNWPQVGILGVGGIKLKPVMLEGCVEFIPHLGLSLTINHQVVDGAPAARFLQTLSQMLTDIDLIMAV